MKNIIKTGLALITLGAFLFSCAPMEKDDYSVGVAPTAEQLSFEMVNNDNVVTFKNTSSVTGNPVWDLGNGSTKVGNEVVSNYPFEGDYTVTMTLYTDGGYVSKSDVLTISKSNYNLIDTPNYRALTNGPEDEDGKTWVFAQYVKGHFGVDDVNAAPKAAWPEGGPWWAANPNDKLESSLYENKFTFVQNGVKFVWKNNGNIYTNENGKNHMGVDGVAPPAGDFDCPYNPNDKSYTFSLDEEAMTITLSDGAFLGHYAGTSTYYIMELTDEKMVLYCKSAAETGNAWYYILVPEELNVAPPVEEPELTAVSLTEDFEGEELAVKFVGEDMGKLTGFYNNPAPFGINKSAKVYAYEKSAAFYSNLSYTDEKIKFDLTDNHVIKLKVYIPSGNDWTTEGEPAGDWITNKNLLPQLAVKLQDSSLGGNAYTTQTEIIKTNLEMDKWIELEFDFSGAADREDYNKIVIQFGAEGHSVPGLFYMDDFYFGE